MRAARQRDLRRRRLGKELLAAQNQKFNSLIPFENQRFSYG
jgi:hypothetical protein